MYCFDNLQSGYEYFTLTHPILHHSHQSIKRSIFIFQSPSSVFRDRNVVPVNVAMNSGFHQWHFDHEELIKFTVGPNFVNTLISLLAINGSL